MLCAKCGANPYVRPSPSGRIRLRATGNPYHPFAVVCESCGGDVDDGHSPADATSRRLALFGLDPASPALMQRSR